VIFLLGTVARHCVRMDKQGQTGFQLDVQLSSVASFVAGRKMIRDLTEIESGKRIDDPNSR